jgi:hypothetical protein
MAEWSYQLLLFSTTEISDQRLQSPWINRAPTPVIPQDLFPQHTSYLMGIHVRCLRRKRSLVAILSMFMLPTSRNSTLAALGAQP